MTARRGASRGGGGRAWRVWGGLTVLLLPCLAPAQGSRPNEHGFFYAQDPAPDGSVLLARPTDRSVTLSVLVHTAATVAVRYAREGEARLLRSGAVACRAGEPREILLDGLTSNALYRYELVDAATDATVLSPDAGSGSFHTCRPPGTPFVFTVQADSHLDGNSDPPRYAALLRAVRRIRPDFHIDLGDTFMTGKIATREAAALQYQAQRGYLGMVGAPLFLILGNHDGEEPPRTGPSREDGLNVWSCLQRKRYFPNPEPGGFYTGNAMAHPQAGLLQNYFAWTWGDALCVALDPYWASANTRGGREPWNRTLGRAQYDWLAHTLRTSRARHKFLFIHQLSGSRDAAGRGGAEAAAYHEWGGREADGRLTFDAHRPGWEKPIHALLVETGVRVVFHGHDHFYARQERDGVVYQLVPQPSARNPPPPERQAAEYGYQTGRFLASPGCLRVTVSPAAVAVAYLQLDAAGTEVRVAADETLPAREMGSVPPDM